MTHSKGLLPPVCYPICCRPQKHIIKIAGRLLIPLLLPFVTAFEVKTPLPSTVTLSQPFTFTWMRGGSDLAFAYLQFGAFYPTTSLIGEPFNAGASVQGEVTMTPKLPGEFELRGRTGFSIHGALIENITSLPQIVFVQAITTSSPIPSPLHNTLGFSGSASRPSISLPRTSAPLSSASGSTTRPLWNMLNPVTTFQLQPTFSQSQTSFTASATSSGITFIGDQSKSNTPVIIGSVIGGIGSFMITCLIILLWRRKKIATGAAARSLNPTQKSDPLLNHGHLSSPHLKETPLITLAALERGERESESGRIIDLESIQNRSGQQVIHLRSSQTSLRRQPALSPRLPPPMYASHCSVTSEEVPAKLRAQSEDMLQRSARLDVDMAPPSYVPSSTYQRREQSTQVHSTD
ncbi:hypothetical protein PM082_012544 [Marasmius tenuissimus]|nr:hypothetical protein PM082_012544 [Marasmius tenuissimus]